MTSKAIKNSPIFTCDYVSCQFMNGDELTLADVELNTLTSATKNGVTGSFYSVDYYDTDTQVCECGYEFFVTDSGNIYELLWYETNTFEAPEVTDFEYASGRALACIPQHATLLQFWHGLYTAVQMMD